MENNRGDENKVAPATTESKQTPTGRRKRQAMEAITISPENEISQDLAKLAAAEGDEIFGDTIEDKDIEMEFDLSMKPDRKVTVRYPKQEYQNRQKEARETMRANLNNLILLHFKNNSKISGVNSLKDYVSGGKIKTGNADKLLRDAGIDESITSIEEIIPRLRDLKKEAEVELQKVSPNITEVGEKVFVRPLALRALESLFEKLPEDSEFSTDAASRNKILEEARIKIENQYAESQEIRRKHEFQFSPFVFKQLKKELDKLLNDVEDKKLRKREAKTDVIPVFNQSRIEKSPPFFREKSSALLGAASEALSKFQSDSSAPIPPSELTYEPTFSDKELFNSLLQVRESDDKMKTLSDILTNEKKFIPFDQQLAKLEPALNRLSFEINRLIEQRQESGRKPIETLEDIARLNQPNNPELQKLNPHTKAETFKKDKELKTNLVLQEALARTITVLEKQIELMEKYPDKKPADISKQLEKEIAGIIPQKEAKSRTTKLLSLTAEFKALNTKVMKRVTATLSQLQKAA